MPIFCVRKIARYHRRLQNHWWGQQALYLQIIIADTFAATNLSRTSVLCPQRHATHAYLASDIDTACWDQLGLLKKCNTPMDLLLPSFTGRNRLDSVPFPLHYLTHTICSFSSLHLEVLSYNMRKTYSLINMKLSLHHYLVASPPCRYIVIVCGPCHFVTN